MDFRRAARLAALAALLVMPIVLIWLPADHFDGGEPLCLSVRLFGVECMGCGLTRGIMHLIHLDINGAAYYNLLSFVVLPLLVYTWARWIRMFWKKVSSIRH
jgi:hypothetical protein